MCFPIFNRRGFVRACIFQSASGPNSTSLIPAGHTKGCCMRRWVAIELVNADDPVVGARSEVTAIRGESDGMDGAQVVAHVAKLSWFAVIRMVGVEDGFGRPDTDMAVYRK